ncbi:MAG: Rne/Rng family ribonuclease [Candidatus Goldiibacteriota bacterium]
MKKFYINDEDFDISVAIADDTKIVNFFHEKNIYAKAGNICKGKVEKVVSNMNFVFVDIGDQKPAFLSEREYFDLSNNIYTEMLDEEPEGMEIKPMDTAAGMFEKGQETIVQIIKEPYSTKGARLTTNVMLPGYYIVYSPFLRDTGVSRRISDDGERTRLKQIIDGVRGDMNADFGIIARTQAEGADPEEIEKEIRAMNEKWNSIKKNIDESKTPSVVYREEELPVKILREYMDENTGSIITDSKESFESIKKYLETTYNRNVDLNLYEGAEPIYEYYGFQNQVEGLWNNIIPFKKGGYIKIDVTEALTVFDINSGKFKGVDDVDSSLLMVNINAAKEIARHIILRNIGGLIVIDFIDMKTEEHNKKIKDVMEEELGKSKLYFKVGDISGFGLMELTRKRDVKKIDDMYFEECPKCSGHGRIMTEENVCIKYIKKIKYECRKSIEENVVFVIPEKIKEMIKKDYQEKLHEYEIKYKKNVILKVEG